MMAAALGAHWFRLRAGLEEATRGWVRDSLMIGTSLAEYGVTCCYDTSMIQEGQKRWKVILLKNENRMVPPEVGWAIGKGPGDVRRRLATHNRAG